MKEQNTVIDRERGIELWVGDMDKTTGFRQVAIKVIP